MDKRTTIALAVIAAAMAAFIAFYESGLLSTGELAERRGRVLERFVRPRVTDVSVERGGETIALHRDREEDLEAFELGHWAMTQPIASDADQDAVDGLLSALEWLEARRTLNDVSDEDRRTFGLAEPRATVRFTVAGDEVVLRVGGEDPRGEGVYVASSDREAQVFVVGSDFLEAIQHDADHFRRKELFTGVRSADASAIELDNATTRARLERAEGRWWVREPWDGIARTSTVDDLFQVVSEVRAARFLAGADAASVGLDQPTRELLVRRERTDRPAGDRPEGTEDRSSPVRLRIGGSCPGHDGEVVAMAGDDGPIVCVTAESIAPLDVGVDRIRESRLASLRDDEIERAEFQAGDVSFELVRGDEGWTLRRGEISGDADEEAIADWARALRETEALSFEPATDEALRARGLLSPRATVTLHRADSERAPDVIRLGADDGDGVWVRRGEEPQIVRYPAAARELVATSSIRFRDRALVHDAEDSAQRLRIVRTAEGGASYEEIVQRDGPGWEVTAPIEVDADRIAVRDVVRAIASLSALRFVAAQAAPEHGLDRPRVQVTATFQGPMPSEDEGGEEEEHDHGEPSGAGGPEREVVLRIGGSAEGGAYARLGDDPAVFVIAQDLVDDLAGPLASRDLLATDASDLESLAIVRGAERIELRREGDHWSAGEGPADPARTTLVLDRLGSLRATGTTSYVLDERAFATPTLVLEVERRGSEGSYQIVVGAAGEPGETGWYHARRSDLAVGYRLGATVVRSYLEYQP